MSWTGSEHERKPQGPCPPPKFPPNRTPRYTIPAGTACEVSKVCSLSWRAHVTAVDLGFDSYEDFDHTHYTFRHRGYFIDVPRGLVRHRDPHP